MMKSTSLCNISVEYIFYIGDAALGRVEHDGFVYSAIIPPYKYASCIIAVAYRIDTMMEELIKSGYTNIIKNEKLKINVNSI